MAKPKTFTEPASPLLDTANRVFQNVSFLLAILLFGYFAAALYYYYQGVYLGKGYPYNTFLYAPYDRFADFDNMVLMCKNLNPYNDHTRSGYPPLANLFFYLVSLLPNKIGFGLFLAIPVSYLTASTYFALRYLNGNLRAVATLIVTFLSLPLLFAIDRGNLDLWVMIATGVYLQSYNSRSAFLRDAGMFSLAIGIAMKLYPAVFLLIPLGDKRYSDLLKIGFLTILLTLISAATFVGGVPGAIRDFMGMMGVTDQMVKGSVVYGAYNLGIFYAVIIPLKKYGYEAAIEGFMHHYWMLAMSFLSLYSLLLLCRKMELWARAACICCLICLTPTLSNDYRLLQLSIPMLLLIQNGFLGEARCRLSLLLMGLLMIPKGYLILGPEWGKGNISIASVIDPILLLMLLQVAMFCAQEWRIRTHELVVFLRCALLLVTIVASGAGIVLLGRLDGPLYLGAGFVISSDSWQRFLLIGCLLVVHFTASCSALIAWARARVSKIG